METWIKKTTQRLLTWPVSLVLFDLLFLSGAVSAEADSGGTLNMPNVGLPSSPTGIQPILVNFLNWLLGIIGLLAVISFVIAGMEYFFAAGDSDTIATAKRNLVYSVIGIIVALSGFIIIQAVSTALNANSSTF